MEEFVKSKGSVLLTVAVVAGLSIYWIGYKTPAMLSGKDAPGERSYNFVEDDAEPSYTLKVNYRDPFLGDVKDEGENVPDVSEGYRNDPVMGNVIACNPVYRNMIP